MHNQECPLFSAQLRWILLFIFLLDTSCMPQSVSNVLPSPESSLLSASEHTQIHTGPLLTPSEQLAVESLGTVKDQDIATQLIEDLSQLPSCKVEHVEVEYFHLTQRCPDCIEAERLTRLTLATSVSYTHLRAHETRHDLVCRLLLEKKTIN